MSRLVGASVMKPMIMHIAPAEVGYKTRIPPRPTNHTPLHDENERPLPCRRRSALRIIDGPQRVDGSRPGTRRAAVQSLPWLARTSTTAFSGGRLKPRR